MRLVSQDGSIDVPYEMCALSIGTTANKTNIYVRSKLFDEKPCLFGVYSEERKALKAMEELRKTYSKIPNNSVEDWYFEDLVFQFPKDKDIKV